MKISELKDKKIVHICIILGIIAIILIIAGIIMLRYQVEGETNLPFELSKMIVISTAESKEIDKVDNLKWNFSINQYNDIYLQFDKNEEYKKCQLKNLQKQQEDMKVAMLVFTKCARKIIRIHRHFLTV